MSYLMRVRLPDVPGTLGLIAATLGTIDADIRSVDVVEHDPDGTVVDDVVVDLPPGRLADALISAAQEVDGVLVDSIRPFSGTVDRRGQVSLLAELARHRHRALDSLQKLIDALPKSMSVQWAVVLESGEKTRRVAASSSAPEDDGRELSETPVSEPRALTDRDAWVPSSWTVMDSALAATPLPGTDFILILGRPGGPDFLLSEIEHLGEVGQILGALLS
ncbi:amino acid-binding ACT domain protein [Corynebacterium kalidii]|uniref:Amino acid-binding ACT domain protein n=1 Tax=Corynebacterium kalidii TaxID=2931982 RepID=A0A9X2B084_9CORY|nr:amino acid-binding ACT domain protein [Corynebacterium kalidii]MCJ7859362.1 amino acid-binding ACT domain protein [Corynebacterium kalidii]